MQINDRTFKRPTIFDLEILMSTTRHGFPKLRVDEKKHSITATITVALVAFALQPIAEAVVPPPDGGYPGGNPAEGQNAFLTLTSGTYNTAVGWYALKSNDLGNYNTAIGAGALVVNSDSVMNTAVGAATLLAN